MQIMKLAAIAIFGVSVVGFSTMTSAGCSSTEDEVVCDPELEDCDLAGNGGSAGTNGDAGSAGSGAGPQDDSATKMAAAIGQGTSCETCIRGITKTLPQMGASDVACAGISAKCDASTDCQSFIAETKSEVSASTKDPACSIYAATEQAKEADSQDFATCVVLGCADECGGLTATGCE